MISEEVGKENSMDMAAAWGRLTTMMARSGFREEALRSLIDNIYEIEEEHGGLVNEEMVDAIRAGTLIKEIFTREFIKTTVQAKNRVYDSRDAQS